MRQVPWEPPVENVAVKSTFAGQVQPRPKSIGLREAPLRRQQVSARSAVRQEPRGLDDSDGAVAAFYEWLEAEEDAIVAARKRQAARKAAVFTTHVAAAGSPCGANSHRVRYP